jgi:hypothetical protein
MAMNMSSAREQPAGRLGTTAERSDSTPTKSKKPQGEIGKQQVLATAGDTVPIVFCKRAGGVGGAWVQPSMVKTATNNFDGSFLYAITQGEMVSSPQRYLAWTGNENIGSKPGTITLTHYYSSAATMAASKNSCPITSGNIFCDLNTYSYLQEVFGSGSFTDRLPSWDTLYNYYNIITRGTGDTSNSVVQIAETDITFINQDDGTDFTSAYWAALGITPSPTAFVYWNGIYSGGSVTGGNTVGTIERIPSSGYTAPNANYFTDLGANGPYSVIYQNATINNQINPSNPASTGTLEGIQIEDHLSTYADPASPSASANFTSFADITFLEIDGNIFDAPSSGSYPTTTRQLCIYYDNGCKVDLYSAGLSGGVYTQGASNQFVDLAMHLFKIIKRVDGASTDDLAAPIDTSNLQDIASYCTNNATFCNGVVDQSLNVIDFISSVAPFFLLSFVSTNGRYSFQPLLPKNGSHQIDVTALTPAATFTEDNILPGSFTKEYAPAEDRRAINISLVWREVEPLNIGIQRTNIVRYPATGNDAPSVQYDMTDVCASQAHAILFGKYELAKRKYSTHSISFATPLLTTALIPTQIIRVTRQRISSKGDNRTETDWYQVTNVKHESDGTSTISAMHFPVDGSNIARISDEVVNGTFEVI